MGRCDFLFLLNERNTGLYECGDTVDSCPGVENKVQLSNWKHYQRRIPTLKDRHQTRIQSRNVTAWLYERYFWTTFTEKEQSDSFSGMFIEAFEMFFSGREKGFPANHRSHFESRLLAWPVQVSFSEAVAFTGSKPRLNAWNINTHWGELAQNKKNRHILNSATNSTNQKRKPRTRASVFGPPPKQQTHIGSRESSLFLF